MPEYSLPFEYKWMEKPLHIRFVGTKPNGGLIFGANASQLAGTEVRKLTDKPVLFVVEPIVNRLGVDAEARKSLSAQGVEYNVYTGVAPEPHLDDAAELIRMVRSKPYGAVIGIGGGSVMDSAKLAAMAAANDGDVYEMFKNPSSITKSLPTMLMPTTSGTGSEVSPYIVMSDAGGNKLFVGEPSLYAAIALVDPVLTRTMPPKVTSSTGIDALTHGLEGAIGVSNPYTMAMAAKCAELVFKYLPRAVKNGDDIEARYYMSFASVLGMLAYTQGGGLYAHSMSYILTARKGLPHGTGCGLALPYTLAYNRPYIQPVISALGEATKCPDFITGLRSLINDIGLPATLAEVCVDERDLPAMSHELIGKYYRKQNPRGLQLAEAEEMLNKMYHGSLE